MHRMQIKRSGRLFDLIPTSGAFTGQVIGQVEQVRLKHATIRGTEISGVIAAVWGLTISVEADPELTKSLSIGRTFGPMGKIKTYRPGNTGYFCRNEPLQDGQVGEMHLDDLGLHIALRSIK